MVKLLAAFFDAVGDAMLNFESFASFMDRNVDETHYCVQKALLF